MKHNLYKSVVCVVRLSYVDLPLARAFARSLDVIGFDINAKKIKRI